MFENTLFTWCWEVRETTSATITTARMSAPVKTIQCSKEPGELAGGSSLCEGFSVGVSVFMLSFGSVWRRVFHWWSRELVAADLEV